MLWAWGELALAEGNGEEALRIAEQLLASPPGANRMQPIPWLLKLKGEAQASMQHLDEAAQVLEEAKEGALQQQERPLLWQIDRSLGRVYHRMKVGGLTEREREVAVLIVQGKSNREIADVLVVSLRTVETHVSTLLSKLGVASRSRIAAWAVEVGLVENGS